MTDDPFPRERLSATLHRVPAYGRLALGLAMDPRLAKRRRAAVVAAAGYLISPIDLVPGVIPVLGQLDDLAVAFAALRFAMAGLDPTRRREHLDAVGLADADLADDLATVGAVTTWTVRTGVRATKRAAVSGARMTASGARFASHAATTGATKVSPHLRDAAAPLARRASAATPDAVKGAGARLAPAARGMTERLTPPAQAAARRMGGAARNAAARGASLVRRGTPRVSVSVPGRRPLPDSERELLPTEPDVLDGRDTPR